MPGFGGSIELQNERAYREALKQITSDLKNLSSQMKLASSEFGKNDSSLTGLNQKYETLRKTLEKQKAAVETAQKAYDSFNKKVAEQGEAHNKLVTKYNEEKAKLEQIGKTLGTTSKEYQDQEKYVKQLEAAVEKSTVAQDKNNHKLQDLDTQLNKAKTAYNNTGKQIDKVVQQTEKASQEHDKFGEVAANATKKAEKGWTVMKDVLAGFIKDTLQNAINGVKNLGRESLEAGINFESAMSKVASISGASADEIEQLTAKAQQMGKTTKFTASESAEAFNYMAMAGWKTEEMLDGLDGILNLAAASGADLAVTSDIVTDALTGMGYQAKDSGRLADVMAAAAANANTNVEKMGYTFQYVTPIAGSLGYSMEDVAVAIGLMANAGIKGERAGTALRSIMQRLASDTGKARTTLEEMGVAVMDAEGNMRPLHDVLVDARKAFSGLDAAQKTSTAHTVAGQEAMAGFLAIMNAAPDDFDKLTEAVRNSEGAAQEMADTMLDNLGGDITILRSKIEGLQIDLYKKLSPALREAVKRFSELIDSVDWDAFGESVKRALDKALDGFEWLIEHKDLVVGAIKAILAAFVVKKVADFTLSIAGMIKEFSKVTSGAAGLISKIAGIGSAAGTAATATGTATAATGGLTTALGGAVAAAGPYIAVIGAAVGVLALVAATTKRSTTAIEENAKATKELAKDHKEFSQTLEETAKARQENIDKSDDQIVQADFLIDRLDKLSKVENKSNAQKEEMARIVDQLNGLMPELNLQYDKEKDSLSKSTGAIRDNIAAQKDLAKAKAYQQNHAEIINQMTEAEEKQAKAVEQNAKNQEAYTKAYNARVDFENKYTPQQIANNIGLQTQLQRLLQTESKAQQTWQASQKEVASYDKEMANLSQEYKEAAKEAERFNQRAQAAMDLSELREKAKAAGRDIPQSLIDGFNGLRYAVPKSIAEMDKLISFDEAINKAGLAGMQIPTRISEGVIAGKISVDEAMNQVRQVMDLSNQAQKAYEDGVAIPQDLAQGILDGSYTVKEANDLMQMAVDFTELGTKAANAGIDVTNRLAEGIRNGTITPQEAIAQMNDILTFQGLVDEATQAGIQIPSTIAEQITLGELAPNEAVQRMQQLMSYQASFEAAGLAGKAIPNALRDGVLSGQMDVITASNAMNSWIEFKKAIATTDAAGTKIPSVLATDIINGKTSVDSAVSQMNNWVQFQAAIKGTQLEGAKVPDELARNILAGKTKPEDAIKEINKLIGNQAKDAKKQGEDVGKAVLEGDLRGVSNTGLQNQIKNQTKSVGKDKMVGGLQEGTDSHSPSRAAQRIGQYFLQGVLNGVNSGSTRNSIFSSIYSLGTSMLARMRASLQEHSPSKATEKMGVYLLQGLSNGISDEQKDVLTQVRDFGREMLDTLNNELSQSLSKDALQGLQNAVPDEFNANIGTNMSGMRNEAQNNHDAMVSAFKEALGQMKIEMDDQEFGSFVDKTVTRLVYN